MRLTLIAAIALLLGSLAAPLSLQAAEPQISGQIVDGLRQLTIGPQTSGNHYTIYRGDYIQPRLADGKPFTMSIPQLKVEKAFPVTDGSKPYIKMKKPGRYPFSAGPYQGVIEVIEYTATDYKELTAAEAVALIDNIKSLLLDVRTPDEFRLARIEGAVLLPVQVLEKNLAALAPHKERPILIYCATGNRSTVASRILIENGFKKVYNLRYGIKDWQKQHPVVR